MKRAMVVLGDNSQTSNLGLGEAIVATLTKGGHATTMPFVGDRAVMPPVTRGVLEAEMDRVDPDVFVFVMSTSRVMPPGRWRAEEWRKVFDRTLFPLVQFLGILHAGWAMPNAIIVLPQPEDSLRDQWVHSALFGATLTVREELVYVDSSSRWSGHLDFVHDSPDHAALAQQVLALVDDRGDDGTNE